MENSCDFYAIIVGIFLKLCYSIGRLVECSVSWGTYMIFFVPDFFYRLKDVIFFLPKGKYSEYGKTTKRAAEDEPHGAD